MSAKSMTRAEETARIKRFITRLKRIQINRELKALSKLEFARLSVAAKKQAHQYNRNQSKAEILEIMRELHLKKIISPLWKKELQALINDYQYGVNTIVTNKVPKFRKAAAELMNPAINEIESRYKMKLGELSDSIADESMKNAAEFQARKKALHEDPELKKLNQQKAKLLRADPVSRIAYACRYALSNVPDMKRASQGFQSKRKIENIENLQLFDEKRYIETASKLILSKKKRELLLGLYALTGRRPGEILKTGKLIAESNQVLTFSGQEKTRGKFRPPYQIPVFVDAFEIVKAFKRLRRIANINEKTGEKNNFKEKSAKDRVYSFLNSDFANLKKQVFGPFFKKEQIKLRSSAATICCKHFKPVDMADEVFFKLYLGHDGLGSVLSYKGSGAV
jgi:telomere resolvase